MASLVKYQKNGEMVEPPLYKYMKGNVQGFLNSIPDPSKMTKEEQLNMGLNANPMMGLLGIKEVLPQLSKFQQERLIKAADLVPNLEKQYTDKALKDAFTGRASQDGGNLFTTIQPYEFTSRHTYPLPDKPHGLLYNSADDIENNYRDLVVAPNQEVYMKHLSNVLRRQGGFEGVPSFNVGITQGYKDIIPDRLSITGHEGRHRTTALDQRGDTKTLVEILPNYSFRNSEKYGTKEWTRNDEASQHYLDMVRKHFDTGISTRYLYPQVNNQTDDAYNYLPIF